LQRAGRIVGSVTAGLDHEVNSFAFETEDAGSAMDSCAPMALIGGTDGTPADSLRLWGERLDPRHGRSLAPKTNKGSGIAVGPPTAGRQAGTTMKRKTCPPTKRHQ